MQLTVLGLARKLNMLLATTLVNNQKDQTVTTDDSATKVTAIDTSSLTDNQKIEITLPDLSTGSTAPTGGARVLATTTANTVANNVKISGSTLKAVQAANGNAKDICFRFTATSKDYQTGV